MKDEALTSRPPLGSIRVRLRPVFSEAGTKSVDEILPVFIRSPPVPSGGQIGALFISLYDNHLPMLSFNRRTRKQTPVAVEIDTSIQYTSFLVPSMNCLRVHSG